MMASMPPGRSRRKASATNARLARCGSSCMTRQHDTRSALAAGSPVRSAAAWRNLPGQAHQRAVGYGSARPVCFARSPGPRSRPAAPCAPPRRGKTCEVNGKPWQLSLAARDQSALPGHQVRANRLAAPCAPPRRGGTCQGRRTNVQSGMAAHDQSALPGHQVRARVRQPRALRRRVEEPARAGAPTCSRVWQRATSLLCQVTRSALASGSPVRSAAAWKNLRD